MSQLSAANDIRTPPPEWTRARVSPEGANSLDGVRDRQYGSAINRLALVGVVVGSALLLLPAASGSSGSGRAAQRAFLSPSGNISCEMDRGNGVGTMAYCQSGRPPQNATLYPDGHVIACYGTGADCLGNPGDRTPTLAYGRSIRLDPFRCTSLRRGVRCVVIRSRHGFLISRSGLSHF
jgi:hypothetical protein